MSDDVLFCDLPKGVYTDILTEKHRQIELREQGRFRFTAADASLTHAERLPMLTEELGEVARQVQQQPDSGLMPVTHAGEFDYHAAGAIPSPRVASGTRSGLRTELIQLAAIAVAWVEAIDNANGTTAHAWKPTEVTDDALNP